MPIPPPAQRITTGLGASPLPANALLKGQAVKLTHVNGETVKDPVALTRVIQEIGSNLRQVGDSASSNPLASSVTITNVTTTGGTQVINHMLNRIPIGWAIVNVRAAGALAYASSPQPTHINPETQMEIVSITAGALVDFLFW